VSRSPSTASKISPSVASPVTTAVTSTHTRAVPVTATRPPPFLRDTARPRLGGSRTTPTPRQSCCDRSGTTLARSPIRVENPVGGSLPRSGPQQAPWGISAAAVPVDATVCY
jgi:hypothetical protein